MNMDEFPSPAGPEVKSRTAYLERMEQMRNQIIERSRRNMAAAVRILRSWLEDKPGNQA